MGTQAKSDLASSLLAYLPASQSRLCYSSMYYKSHTCLPGTQSQDNYHVFLSGGFLLFVGILTHHRDPIRLSCQLLSCIS